MYISHVPVSIKLVNAQIGSLLKPTVLFSGAGSIMGGLCVRTFIF